MRTLKFIEISSIGIPTDISLKRYRLNQLGFCDVKTMHLEMFLALAVHSNPALLLRFPHQSPV